MLTLLFPSSYLYPKKVDEDLQTEYDVALETGLYNVRIFNYEKWFVDGKLVLDEVPEEETKAVYRGWMMKPEKYNAFYTELKKNNIELITKPEEYERFHVFPNIYKEFGDDTAKMLVYPIGTEVSLEEVNKTFTRFMVKDYVKSVKGTEFPVYLTNDITEMEFKKWMEVFYKYRGDLFTGGICIKEFLDLKKYENKTNEYRVFYINNSIATISRNSLQPSDTKEPPKDLIEKYKNLDSSFYTIDYAELEDGSWKIIEAGDGSVSGLSEGQKYVEFYEILSKNTTSY